MSKLLPTPKSEVIGFILIDSAGHPLATTGTEILKPAKDASFFIIHPLLPRKKAYRVAHKRAQYFADRHNRHSLNKATVKSIYST